MEFNTDKEGEKELGVSGVYTPEKTRGLEKQETVEEPTKGDAESLSEGTKKERGKT